MSKISGYIKSENQINWRFWGAKIESIMCLNAHCPVKFMQFRILRLILYRLGFKIAPRGHCCILLASQYQIWIPDIEIECDQKVASVREGGLLLRANTIALMLAGAKASYDLSMRSWVRSQNGKLHFK